MGAICLGGAGMDTVAAIAVPDARMKVLLIGGAAMCVGVSALQSEGAERQLNLRDQLEKNIASHDYQDRFFASTTEEWCNRQTATVICQKNGVLDKYQQLCEELQDSAKFTWVPHI
jgi:hypothetical protein